MMLTVDEIKRIIPHREPFLMIDRIVELSPGESGTGIKAVSANEWYFQGHFEGMKIMPGVLVIESMAQVGAVIILTKPEYKGCIALFGGIRKARFHKSVYPGDMLRLETVITSWKEGFGLGDAKAFVDGQLVASAELVFSVKPAEER